MNDFIFRTIPLYKGEKLVRKPLFFKEVRIGKQAPEGSTWRDAPHGIIYYAITGQMVEPGDMSAHPDDPTITGWVTESQYSEYLSQVKERI